MHSNGITNTVVMVHPAHFGFNPETAASNTFQHHIDSETDVQQKALVEFDHAVSTLEQNGITVLILPSRTDMTTPDSIFPNNWFSHHRNGTLIIYPMLTPNRRAERQTKKLEKLLTSNNIPVTNVIDLSIDEKQDDILEGTGSLVLDRVHKVAFAMESARTTRKEFDKWISLMGYNGVFFDAYEQSGHFIYHTNVAMSVGDTYAIICLDSITSTNERKRVEQKLRKIGKHIIRITTDQVAHFCGNTLQLRSSGNEPVIVMSETAYHAFTKNQKKELEKYGRIVTLAIPTIETIGGGSARCMLAEVFS